MHLVLCIHVHLIYVQVHISYFNIKDEPWSLFYFSLSSQLWQCTIGFPKSGIANIKQVFSEFLGLQSCLSSKEGMGWWVTITVQLLIFGLKDSWCYRGDVAMQFYVISSRQPTQTGELVLVSLSYTIMKENTNQIAAGSKYQDCGRTVAGVKRWWTDQGGATS